jgi:hypothetical protein
LSDDIIIYSVLDVSVSSGGAMTSKKEGEKKYDRKEIEFHMTADGIPA